MIFGWSKRFRVSSIPRDDTTRNPSLDTTLCATGAYGEFDSGDQSGSIVPYDGICTTGLPDIRTVSSAVFVDRLLFRRFAPETIRVVSLSQSLPSGHVLRSLPDSCSGYSN